MGDNIDQYDEDDMTTESIQTPKPKKVSAKRKMASIENVKKAQAALRAKRAAKKEEKRKELVEEVIKDKKYEEAMKLINQYKERENAIEEYTDEESDNSDEDDVIYLKPFKGSSKATKGNSKGIPKGNESHYDAIKELKEDMCAIHSQFEKFILTQEKVWVAKDKKALNKDKEVIKQLKYLNL